jgi:hypothetical protein
MAEFPYGKDSVLKAATAVYRHVAIAPAKCECGRDLRWNYIFESHGKLTTPRPLHEQAFCPDCEIIWTTRES